MPTSNGGIPFGMAYWWDGLGALQLLWIFCSHRCLFLDHYPGIRCSQYIFLYADYERAGDQVLNYDISDPGVSSIKKLAL